ncbi:MAG: DPP IV N-terminal domain-containing protein [Prevotella sp.]|jgi:dipeptidyl-peptidase-4
MKINGWIIAGAVVMASTIGLSEQANAQETLKQFSLEDLNFGGNNYHNMTAKNRFTTWWGDELVRLDLDKCYIVDKKTGKETLLFSLEDANKWLGNHKGNSIHSLYYVSFPYADKPIARFEYGSRNILLNFETHQKEWSSETQNVSMLAWNPVSRASAYIGEDGHNLFVRNAEGDSKQLSTDGSADIVYGQSVHRDEFGYSKGTFWSPDGQKLMFTRMDQSMVTSFPLVDIPTPDSKPKEGQSRIAKPAPEKYPMAGEPMHKVTIGIYNVQSGSTIYLKAGDPTDRYFTNPAWSPDSKTVYLFELNRDQNDCRLVSYNAETGEKIAELYRETNEKYVEPLHPIVFLPWDDDEFVMQSQKDGYNHLYLFNKNGKLIKQLTSGKWVVMELLGFNKKDKTIIIASNERNAIQRNLYSINVKNGKRTLIDESGDGYHYGSLSASGAFLLDRYSTPTEPRNIAIVDVKAQKAKRYFTAENPWKGYNIPDYKCGTIKAADGLTDLYYRMVMPIGFDPAKKYPTIVYVYGGPHAHNVDARWHYGSRSWETYMAQKGYLLFILDNRGSENRGRDFEQATFRHLGDTEMKDQMKGVDFLKSLPYVDTSRLGVHGWSFGGFMTINLMTTYPDVFKVGVAGGPVIDWKWYEVMYGERYMDTPQTNPDGYAQSSLIHKAKNLKGRLQIIIGLNDPVVVPQHSFTFISQCILDGTQPDFFVYPGEPHNMRGHQSTHLHERISRYFDDFLK